MAKRIRPTRELLNICLSPKKAIFGSLGGLFITPISSFSDSKAIEHTGSMINSMNTICKGMSKMGKAGKKAGKRASPIIGICMAMMYPIAFCRLSKILLPDFMAMTIELKLSSNNTREDDSLATSVPFPPMEIPISAAFKAGASFTPSPVIATTSPFALSALMICSFCSGIIRAKILTCFIFSFNSLSDRFFKSWPVKISSCSLRPACFPIFFAVSG